MIWSRRFACSLTLRPVRGGWRVSVNRSVRGSEDMTKLKDDRDDSNQTMMEIASDREATIVDIRKTKRCR